jgi:hypothetical protein
MKKAATYLLILAFMAFFHQAYSQYSQSERADSINRSKEASLPAWTFNFNPVGFGLYGPIVQLEFKVANRGYVVPWIRYSYAGVVSQYQWTNFESDSRYDPSSASIAVGYKVFIPGDEKDNLIFYGFFGEFIHEKGLHDMNTDYQYDQTRNAIAVYGNLGYRWKSKRNFFVSLGILPGYTYDLKNEGTFSNSGGQKQGIHKENNFIGMLDINFGWNFEN